MTTARAYITFDEADIIKKYASAKTDAEKEKCVDDLAYLHVERCTKLEQIEYDIRDIQKSIEYLKILGTTDFLHVRRKAIDKKKAEYNKIIKDEKLLFLNTHMKNKRVLHKMYKMSEEEIKIYEKLQCLAENKYKKFKIA